MKKVVVITGASSGIGNKTAKYLSQKGYKVYGLSRRVFEDEAVNMIKCDITNIDEVKLALKTIYEIEGQIDAVVNNAGLGVSGAIEYQTKEELLKIFDLNVFALIGVCQEALKYLRETKGRIINIGSVAGELTIPFQTYYSMTKVAVSTFSEGLRMEVKPFGIKVVTVMPGDTKTDFTKNRDKPIIKKDPIYKDRIINSLSKMEKDEQNGVDPIFVSKVIYKMLKKKNPPVKVTVGVSYKFLVFLKRILPTRFVNYILYKMYAK